MSEYAPEYNTQASQAGGHVQRMVGDVGAMVMGLGGVRGAAQGVAADMQQMSSGFAAASRVTHQSTQTLVGDAMALSRAFPMATKETLATVGAVQSLGLTSRGQERQVGALTKSVTQLAAATGTSAPAMARDFGLLNKEMGSLDPSRVSKMADVVTTMSARSGANAQGIVQFAKTLSPLAQTAGIGQTALLGMATSFTKLGDDGYVAANAVTKMLGDMNRAVRDGGTEMAGYANAVGMTVDQFKALYNADPSRAVATVTQAVGKMPQGQAQRTLDQLGIEGVRAQRVFLNQARSGGMMADIQAAQNAYGSGSTAQASQTATATVYSSLTRLGNAATDVAYAFERPLLGAVSSLVNVAGGITRGAAGVLNTGPVHGAINIASQAALPLAVGRMAYTAVSRGALASLVLRSGPVTGFLGGIRAGRLGGVQEAVDSGARSRPVRAMLERELAGEALGTNAFRAGMNSRAMQAGATLGAIFPAGGTGPGMMTRLRGMAVLGGGMGLRSSSEAMRLSRLLPHERDDYMMRSYGPEAARFSQNLTSIRGAVSAGTISRGAGFAAAAKELDLLTLSSAKAGPAIKALGLGVGDLARQTTATAARGLWGGTKMGAGALARVATNPFVLGGGLAYAGYQVYQGEQAAHRRQDARTDDLDMYGALNTYREAMGKAGEASMTLSDQMHAAAQTISAAVTTMGAATHVSAQDRSAAQRNTTVNQRYSGTAAQVGAQVGMLNLNGLQPSDVQGAKLDLIRAQNAGQLPSNFDINSALASIPAASGGRLSDPQIAAAVTGMAAAPGLGHVGFGLSQIRRIHLPGESGAWRRVGSSGSGGPQLGKAATSQLGLLQGSLMQEQANLGDRYGADYGAAQSLKDADKAMRAALKTHNADLVVGMEQQLTEQFLGKGHSVRGLTAQDIQKQGGLIGVLQGSGRNISGTNYRAGDLLNQGAHRTFVEDSVARTLQDMGSGGEGLARFFSNTTSGNRGIAAGQKALTAADQAPEDLQKQHDAVMAIVDGGQKAGMSLGELAAQAARSTTAMSDSDARAAVMVGVIAEANRRLQAAMPGMTTGQRFGAQANMAGQLAGVTGQSQAAQNARAQGQDMATSTLNDERSFMQQRLMVQRNFEIQSERAWRDYHTSVDRAQHDFQQQQQFAEEDFYRQRGRAVRDYNISLRRQIQDAGASMYNPFQRIQAVPTWDAANLIGNRGEQLTALRQQLANIKRLRSLGLSQASIDQMRLYEPANAQQVTELVEDLSSNRGEAGQLNRQTTQIQAASGELLKQAPSYRRSKEDFARSMRDSRTDYNTAVARQNTLFQTQMQRQRHDFGVQLGDAQTDIKNADKEITGDMTTLQKDMNNLLKGQAVDWTSTLKSTLADTISTIQNTTPQLLDAQKAAIYNGGKGGSTGNAPSSAIVAGAGYSGLGNRRWTGGSSTAAVGTSNLTMHRAGGKGVNAGFMLSNVSKPGTDTDHLKNKDLHWGKDVAVAPDNRRLGPNAKLAQRLAGGYGWGDGEEWAALFQIWNQESGFSPTAGSVKGAYGIPQAMLSSHPDFKLIPNWKTNAGGQIGWGLDYIARSYGDPLGAWAHKSRTGWYAQGGIAMSPHVGVVAEKGSPEAMIPLNAHGMEFLAGALRSYLTPTDAAALGHGGGREYAVTVNQSYHYDQRLDMSGSTIKVEASDPTKMKRALEDKTQLDNLTASRSRR